MRGGDNRWGNDGPAERGRLVPSMMPRIGQQVPPAWHHPPLAETTPSVPSQHPGTCHQDGSTTPSPPLSGVMRSQE